VELIHAVRVYIECLSHIHNDIRSAIRETVNGSRQEVSAAISNFESASGKKPIGVTVIACDEENESIVHESFQLLLEWDDIRLELEKSNKPLKNLHKRYVSGVAYNQ
jgi:hypothetical protein